MSKSMPIPIALNVCVDGIWAKILCFEKTRLLSQRETVVSNRPTFLEFGICMPKFVQEGYR